MYSFAKQRTTCNSWRTHRTFSVGGGRRPVTSRLNRCTPRSSSANPALSGPRSYGAPRLQINADSSCGCYYMVAPGQQTAFTATAYAMTTNCVLCTQNPETINHLFLQCVYAREVWFNVLRRLGLELLAPQHDHALIAWWLQSRRAVARQRRKCFDLICLLVVWHIWLERNARVFRQVSLQPTALLRKINELELWCLANIVSRSQITAM